MPSTTTLTAAPRNCGLRVLTVAPASAELKGAGVRPGAVVKKLEQLLSGAILSVFNTKLFLEKKYCDTVEVAEEEEPACASH